MIGSTQTLYLMSGVCFTFGDATYGWVMLSMGALGSLINYGSRVGGRGEG